MKKHFYIAIADVHGRADALRQALLASKQFVGDNPYTIVFLGDLIDRGGEENEVLTIVKEEVEAGAILITGNHDYFLLGTAVNDPREAYIWDINDGWNTCVRMFGLVQQKLPADLQQFREWLFARGYDRWRVEMACKQTTLSWSETIKNSWQYELLNKGLPEWHSKKIYFCHAPQIDVSDYPNTSPYDLMWGDWETYSRHGEDDSLFKVPGNFLISVHGHIHKLRIDYNFPRIRMYEQGSYRAVILADSGCGCGSIGKLHPIILSETTDNKCTVSIEAIL